MQVEAPLRVVPELASYQSDSAALLGLKGQFQHANAALAVALCQEWEQHHVATAAAPSDAARERVAGLQAGKLPPLYQAGLAACQFAGRAQTVSMGRDDVPGDVDTSADTEAAMSGQNDITFFMDGAHTPESMSACARCDAFLPGPWQCLATAPPTRRPAAQLPSAASVQMRIATAVLHSRITEAVRLMTESWHSLRGTSVAILL